jgi:TonB family protein
MSSSGTGLIPAAEALVAVPRLLGASLPAWIAGMTLATAVVLVGALAADRLLERRVSAAARVLLFAPVLLRVFLPARFPSPLGIFDASAPAGRGLVSAGEPVLASAAGAAPAGVVDGAALLGLGHLAVTAALLAIWIFARARIARAVRGARGMGVHPERRTPIVEHDRVGPVVVGVLRPRIVVPASLARGEPDALAAVLAHEAAHVARRDQILAPVVQLVCLLAWPILPVWIAARRIRALVEVACDERALRGQGIEARRRYGEILVALAEGRPPVRGHLLAPSFVTELRGRLRALRARRHWGAGLQGVAVLAPALALLACSGAGEPVAEPNGQETTRRPLAEGSATAGEAGRTEARPADVDTARAEVRGSLDKEIIRRIVRRHVAEVKACYEPELGNQPELAGRIVVQWTIGATGQVVASDLQSSTMGSPGVEACVVRAVRRWEFPKPLGGGVVTVSYPFDFTPGSGAPAASAGAPPRTGVVAAQPSVARPPADGRSPSAAGLDLDGVAPEVKREMRARLGVIKACYERALRAHPLLTGQLTLRMTIGGDGAVTASRVEHSTIPLLSLDECLVSLTSKFRFPAPRGGEPVEVSFPIVFKADP